MSPLLPEWILPPLWVHPEQTLLAGLVQMQERGCPVGCERPAGLFWLTQQHILAVAATGVELGSKTIGEIWEAPPLWIEGIGDPETVLAQLQEADLDYAPVVAAGGVVGIASQMRLQAHCLAQVQQRCQTYENLLDASPEIIRRLDPHLRHLYVNGELERATGIPKSDFLGKSLAEMGLPETILAPWQAAAQAVLQTGVVHKIELSCPTTQRWYAVTMVPERDPKGQISSLFVYSRDITQGKTTETFTQTLLQLLPDLVKQVDRYGNTLRFYSYGSQVHLLQPAGSLDAHTPENASRWLKEIAQALQQRQIQTFEQVLTVAGNTHCHCEEVRLIPFDQDSVIAIIRDITPYYQARQALIESEARFRDWVRHVPGAVFQYVQHRDGRNRVIYLNPGCEKLWEVSAAAVEQDSRILWDMVLPEDRPAMVAAVQRSAEDLRPWEWVWRITTPSGTLKWLHGYGQPRRLSPEETLWNTLIVDVTETMQAKLALEASQAQLKSILNAVNGVIKRFFLQPDFDWHYEYISESAERVLGYGAGELLRTPQLWTSRVPPEDWHQILKPALLTLTQQDYVEVEFRFQHRDQRWLWISAMQSSRWDPERGGWEITCLELDITERKHTQLRLQQRLDQAGFLNQLVQSIQAAVNLEGIFDLVTTGLGSLVEGDHVTVTRYHPEEAIWFCMAEYRRHPQIHSAFGIDVPDAANPVAARLRQGETLIVDASPNLDPINQKLQQAFPGAWLMVPITSQGQTWGAINLRKEAPQWQWQQEHIELAQHVASHVALALQKIQFIEQLQTLNEELRYQVEVRNAELQQLLKNEQLSRQITEEIRSRLQENEILQITVNRLAETLNLFGCLIALRLSDEEYLFRYASENFPVEITGTRWHINRDPIPQILRGEMLYFSTVHPLWGASVDLVTPIRDDQDVLGFLRLLRPPGSEFSAAEMAIAQEVASQCAIGIRQARLFQKIQEQVEELQRINQIKDEFLHMVSHELRTPLASMKMALHMLEVNPDPQAQKRYREILRAEWNRELSLVNELLELQSLESGTKEVTPDAIILRDWVGSLLPPFELRCAERQQQFQCLWDLQVETLVTDPNLLERVILELLNNACKYTPPHESITLHVNSDENQVRFQVVNTGVTIPADQLSKIFEKFHRIPTLDRYNQGGTGLGLALVQKAVSLLGGEIQVASAEQHTAFEVVLPRVLSNR